MQNLLFLCHRLPWPPTKGDKIRSYHVFRRFAQHYRVYLGAFVDDPDDWQYVPAVKAMCVGSCIRPLRPWRARLRSLAALVRGEPLTAAYYHDREMRRWVEQLLTTHSADLALCYSSGVAPFLMPHKQLRRVMDFVDVDSDKWYQYAETRRSVMGVIYRRESRRLAEFERSIAAQFDASIFVSEAEARLFRTQVPELATKVHGISNGVDSEYWNPERDYSNPYPPGQRALVFIGAMDYWANVDAAQWFAREIWPRIHVQRPEARLYIVGTRPAPAVRALGQLPGVTVTGRVEDVRPHLAHAHAAATPLRIARGIQNKVLEALAMAKVLLATPQAYEGIEDFDGRQGCISDAPEVLVAAALAALDRPQPLRVPQARALAVSHYHWQSLLDIYQDVLDGARPCSHRAPLAPARAGAELCR